MVRKGEEMKQGIHRPKIYNFEERVEQVIKDSGMSKCEIARKAGFDRKILSFNFGWHLSAYNLMAFCQVTGVSADYLLGLRKEMKR